MTKQEMFDKAVKGLASQDFERCRTGTNSGCAYANEDGTKHCAWGWVDTQLASDDGRFFSRLRREGVGIAATLGEEEAKFAGLLQNAHDHSTTPSAMKWELRSLAKEHHLTIPEELS